MDYIQDKMYAAHIHPITAQDSSKKGINIYVDLVILLFHIFQKWVASPLLASQCGGGSSITLTWFLIILLFLLFTRDTLKIKLTNLKKANHNIVEIKN